MVKTIVRVKYSRQAIPREYAFNDPQQAKTFAAEKKAHNPYVRWIELDNEVKYADELQTMAD
jgi:hypothetical protein